MLELARWSYAAHLAWQVVWWAVLNPPDSMPTAMVLSIALVPLLVFLPAVWRKSPRGLVLAGCVMLFYFAVGVMEWWAGSTTRLGGAVQTLLSVTFIAAFTAGLRRAPRM